MVEAVVDVSGLIELAVDGVLFPLEFLDDLIERAEVLHLVFVFPAAPFSFAPIAFVNDFFGCGADAWIGVAQEGSEMSAFLAVDSPIEVDTLLYIMQGLADLQFLRAEFEALATEVPAVSLSRELLVGFDRTAAPAEVALVIPVFLAILAGHERSQLSV